jgi:hypothetical protein
MSLGSLRKEVDEQNLLSTLQEGDGKAVSWGKNYMRLVKFGRNVLTSFLS